MLSLKNKKLQHIETIPQKASKLLLFMNDYQKSDHLTL